MINMKRTVVNAGSSVVQIIVSGLVLFVLYRFLLETLGPEKLGIWTLVLSASSMVQMANFGLSGSIVKHIADYDAANEKKKMVLCIQTAVISIALFSMLIIGAAFPLAKLYFAYVLDIENQLDAIKILPIALLCFWINMVTAIYQGALYGCHLIVHRNCILIFDSISHLLLCVFLSKELGLIGLAYARLIQNILTMVTSIIILKLKLSGLPIIPSTWNKKIFREMLGYATNFQIITLLVMLSDPITKGFLSKYGTVSMVSYYEMANKLVQLFRSLIVNANQVLVPSYANLKRLDKNKIENVFISSYKMVMFIALPGFFLLIISAPIISELWIGSFDQTFSLSITLLSVGWLLNTLSVPAYFAGIGTGNMIDNVFSHLFMSLSNIILIILIGMLWGGLGVILSWAISISIGGIVLNFSYFYKNKIKLKHLIPADNLNLIITCFIGIGISYIINIYESNVLKIIFKFNIGEGPHVQLGMLLLPSVLFVFLMFFPMWKHPFRKKIFKHI